jgi:hypothetical protein
MASTYNLTYTFTRCTNNGSSNTYTNDFVRYSVLKAKAIDGCYFVENDGSNNFFIYNGNKNFPLNFEKVSSADDQKVIDGELTGITSDGKYACRRLRLDGTITGDIQVTFNATGGSPVEPVSPVKVTNNVLHTTYKTEVQGNNTVITLTCENGFVFDGVPTVTYGADPEDPFADATTENMTVSGNVATFTLATDSYGGFAALDGKTKASEPPTPPTPTEPTVTNNITDATESHTVDGSSVTVNLTSKKVMLNVSCAYVGKDGSNKNVPVTVNVVINDVTDHDTATSNASVTLPDVDFNHPIVITGETKQAMRIDYNLSGCTPVTKPTYCFVGEPLTITLTADSGNEFNDAAKCTITGYNSLTGGRVVQMTISEDKLTATGTITPTVGTYETDDWFIVVDGVANPQTTPTKKYGFINAYVLNEQNLEDFATARFVPYTGDYPSTKEDPISYDLGDYVNRVKRFFFPVEKGSTSKLMCGNFQVDTNVFNLASDTKVISFGSVDIPNVTESTADYDTDLNMFVPFIGLETLPVDLIGHTVALELRVNLLGGGGVYVLTCEDRIVYTKEVEPCTDVLFRTQKQEVRVLGGSKFDSTYLMGLTPYIVLQKKTITSTGVETASSRLTKVKDVVGFTKLVNVKFEDTSNMLMDDVNTIINILRNGFTL